MIKIIKYFPDQFNIHRRFSLNQKGAREGNILNTTQMVLSNQEDVIIRTDYYTITKLSFIE